MVFFANSSETPISDNAIGGFDDPELQAEPIATEKPLRSNSIN